ncbi:MAG TPA: hypothetical protein VMF09_00245 [Solirubrobacteraceae bacterium]|nr:hypothetical protein [Solirubrobacteraceae bacterium]
MTPWKLIPILLVLYCCLLVGFAFAVPPIAALVVLVLCFAGPLGWHARRRRGR